MGEHGELPLMGEIDVSAYVLASTLGGNSGKLASKGLSR